jgi:hypothetical protein
MLRRVTLWFAAGLVLLSLASFGAIGWIGSERALHPEYHQYEWSLATFPDLDPEHIQVRSVDNVLLDGRFFPGAHSSLVILSSGYGDTQDRRQIVVTDGTITACKGGNALVDLLRVVETRKRRRQFRANGSFNSDHHAGWRTRRLLCLHDLNG